MTTVLVTAKIKPGRLRFGLMLSPSEVARPIHVREAMIATLFGRVSNVAMLAVAAAICGWLAFERGGSSLTIVISGLEIVVIAARCGEIQSYLRAARNGIGDASARLWRFGWLALASSALWGSLCFIALSHANDPVLYTVPVVSTVGIAGSIAARNSAVPRLAKAQLVLSLAPILAGCMLAGDHGFRAFLLLVPAMAIGLFVLIDERNAQLVTLMESQHKLQRLSNIDGLTEIANRRAFDEELHLRLATRRSFALLMIDVDDFKRFNDRFGHPAGDLLLKRLAATLKAALRRQEDFVARYGGEEFVILLEDVRFADLAAVSERILRSVSSSCSDLAGGRSVTISIGAVERDAEVSAEPLIQQADEALYRAKRGGRNRVVVSGDPSRSDSTSVRDEDGARGLVVKNGSNVRATTSGGMPVPVSVTLTTTSSPEGRSAARSAR